MPKLPLVYRIEVVPLTPLYGRRDPCFSYASPTPILSGSLISISFGRRTLTGVALGSARLPGPVPQWMKYVGVTLLPGFLTADQIALAWELSERLYTPLGMILKLFFPLQRKPRTIQSTTESLAVDVLSQTTQPLREAVQRKKRTHPLSFMEAVPSDTRLLDRLIALGGQAVKKQKLLCLLVPEVLAAELYTKKLQTALPQARVCCLSSRRTPKEQYEIYQAIRSQTLDIVVGTRQAVFAPYVSLGNIVIIDSEKQLSYTQWEMAPRYDAVEVAEWIAQRHAVPCIKLSVAPGIRYFAEDLPLKRTGKPFVFSRKHALTTIDLRKSYTRHRTSPVLSADLIAAIRRAHAQPAAILILVKQRGVSRFSLCAKCHTPQRCPKCQTILSEMKDGRFRCLTCSYQSALFPACASCGHMHFKSFGAGTQAIERALQREGLDNAIIVIDRDTTQLKSGFQKIVAALTEPTGPPIIIATYETAYSLPLPPLGLIALIEPDQGLFYPDYQTEERLWRELRRFGAKIQTNGTLSVQTFEPESAFWTTWVQQPLETTAEGLLEERRSLRYPPYYHLIQLECYPQKGSTSLVAAEQAEALLHRLALPEIEILQKYLPFNRKNRYHILIRYPVGHVLPEKLRLCLTALGPNIRITHNPLSLLG